MKICIYCGAELPDEAKACSNCGRPLPVPDVTDDGVCSDAGNRAPDGREADASGQAAQGDAPEKMTGEQPDAAADPEQQESARNEDPARDPWGQQQAGPEMWGRPEAGSQDRWGQSGVNGQNQWNQPGASGQNQWNQPGASGQNQWNQPGASGQNQWNQPGADGQNQWNQPGAYGQNQWNRPGAYGYTPSQQRTHGLAVASLVLGIAALFLNSLYFIPSMMAIGFGIAALLQIRKAPQYYRGGGLAVAGIILGAVFLIVYIALFLYAIHLMQDPEFMHLMQQYMEMMEQS